jgi:asparagine synthase (glutamine-hydrolysing)
MLARLSHRGPDDEGTETVGNATLGVRRLSIIDLTSGHQPMANESGDVVAVQNGELYNFAEIRADLVARGHVFRTKSDTEILPHGWEEWGPGIVERIRGMFAFAIHDARTRTLFVARDRFGKKPLVYARVPGGIAFASEIQALLAHPAVSRDIDESAIDAYLSLGYVPAPLTAFADVRKLPAAHTLTYRDGEISVDRYWRLRAEPKLELSLGEAAEELRGLLDEAVRLRLIADVPIGVFLSGGLDSSTVVAFMKRHADRVRTFSIGFADEGLNELPHARAIARAFGTEHEELVVDHQDVDALPMLVRHIGEPFADSSIVPTYQVAKLTRPHVTVALTGDGGDELFLGYDRYRAAAIAHRSPLRPVGPALAALGARLPTGHAAPRPVARAARFLGGLGVDGEERYLRWSGYFTGPLRRAVIGDALARTDDVAAEYVHAAYDVSVGSEAERYALADLELGLPGDLLTKMDIATMAASLEARSPLLDHRLAEFVARLPVGHKLSARRSKIVLREAMADILPPSILARGKSGFMAPVGAWLRGPLRPMFEDLVPSGEAVRRGWVSAAGVRRLYADHESGRTDRTRHLWALLVLELWWREVASVSRPETRAAAS